MPFVAAPVKIPEYIHHILFKFSKSRTLPARQVQRAKIILLAADGMNNMQISTRVGPGQQPIWNLNISVMERSASLVFFDVATGRMEKPYLNSTRTEKDFVEAIRALIETDPEAPWTFVCDGLNIHKSESLVRFVAGQCGLSEDLGSKGRSGILKNQESRAEFLHHKDHRIRIVYTPKHCSWMNQIEIWFSIINRRLLKRKSYQSIEELKASILRFVEQYNVMAKPFSDTL